MNFLLPGAATLDWGGWLYGLVAAFIGGAASAVIAGGSAAVVIPGTTAKQALTVAGTTFVVAGVFSGMNYLAKQPLPAKVVTTTTTETSGGPAPESVVTKKVEEVKVVPEEKK
jgi:hypothetical protein